MRHPIRAHCGLSLQPAYVLREVAGAHARNVLEVGCGRGFCTFYLANLMPDVNFWGVDLVPRHAEFASQEASKGGYENVHFSVGSASGLHELGMTFDVIFSVEAMCHLDTDQKMEDFLCSAASSLTPKGKIVLVDGFRSRNFNRSTKNQQLAMVLAEKGFRIRRMPSKDLWTKLASEAGFSVVRDVDLTEQVLPFWRFGWRFARAALNFPRLIRFLCFASCCCHLMQAACVAVTSLPWLSAQMGGINVCAETGDCCKPLGRVHDCTCAPGQWMRRVWSPGSREALVSGSMPTVSTRKRTVAVYFWS